MVKTKEDTQKMFIINSLFFYSSFHRQTTRLETEERHHWARHWNQTQHSHSSIWVVMTKETRHRRLLHQQFILIFSHQSTGNDIGDTGATSLSETLKSNTTLTKLYLWSEDKRTKDTRKRDFSAHHSFHLINRQHYWRHRNPIICWIIRVKHNTHWTQSEMWKWKKIHKRHPSTIHSFPCTEPWMTMVKRV